MADRVPIEAVREQFNHAMTLRPTKSEIHYLRGTNEYQDRMFAEDYLEFYSGYQLPEYDLSVVDGNFKIEFAGPWAKAIYWETIALSILNELFYRYIMAPNSRFEYNARIAEGYRNLADKIRILKGYPGINFIEFGTRRRFSLAWQDEVVRSLAEELAPTQFRGTSNTFLAAKYGLLPMGTEAHETKMVLAAHLGKTKKGLLSATDAFLNQWWEMYGEGLSVALTDTFGTDYFLRTFGEERARAWKGMRQDSGDPFEFGERVIRYYEEMGIDPKEKLIIFSDGLEIETIVNLYKRFNGRIKISFGWGTNLTNDLGFPALSLVVKIIEASGRPAVKLSDNLAKALGKPEEVARYKRAFGYETTYNKGVTY
jgi:nicotinate phosphoribosyltransferase